MTQKLDQSFPDKKLEKLDRWICVYCQKWDHFLYIIEEKKVLCLNCKKYFKRA